ncbi:hypothetical protein EC973_006341 [Apophysomyces ossiformis]|uniref:Uncharacterized protein n=1 Tax=Apophysomyces ossiformis TaxID=679940 RepID=A0A8H7C0Q6_9FUNG|nr:hypothetical protein EC973_006341 [Apophysomyces ossiformis]
MAKPRFLYILLISVLALLLLPALGVPLEEDASGVQYDTNNPSEDGAVSEHIGPVHGGPTHGGPIHGGPPRGEGPSHGGPTHGGLNHGGPTHDDRPDRGGQCGQLLTSCSTNTDCCADICLLGFCL